MKRLQISLEPELDQELDRMARASGVSKAEIVRRCIRERAEPIPAVAEDPVLGLFGIVEGGEPGDSATIDEVVYGR
jgi:hypothetical protein